MGRQTFAAVFVAELKRMFLRRKAIIALCVYTVGSVLVALAVDAVLRMGMEMAAQEGAQIGEIGPAGFVVCVGFLSFTLGLYCASAVSGDYTNAMVSASLAVVPNRSRLYAARLLSWVTMSFVCTFVPRLLLMLMYLGQVPNVAKGLLDVFVCSLVMAVFITFVFGLASSVRRGSLAVLGFLGLDLILPFVLPIVSVAVPSPVRPAVDFLNNAMPGNAFNAVVDTSASATSSTILFGVVALLVWAVAANVFGRVAFDRVSGTAT